MHVPEATETEAESEQDDRQTAEESSNGHPVLDRDLSDGAVFEGTIATDTLDLRLRHIESISEARLRVTEGGLGISAVDSANVSMIQLVIPAALFERYEVEQKGQVGLSVGRSRDWLKSIDTDQTHIRITADSEVRFADTAERVHAGGGLIEPDSVRREPDVPNLELTSVVEIDDIQHVRSFLKKVDKGSHLKFRVSESGLSITQEKETHDKSLLLAAGDQYEPGEGDATVLKTTDDGNLGATGGPSNVTEFHAGEETDETFYSADYLDDFFRSLLKRHAKGVSYMLRFSTEFPMFMRREPEVAGELCRILLAPRIKST